MMAGLFLLNGYADARAVDTMAAKLAKGAKKLQSRKVVVLPLTYADGWTSTGSTLIAEELTTALVGRKGITIIERSQLDKVMSETRLELSGITEAGAVQKLGKVLGADAIVTGTLTDIDDHATTANVRLIRSETGEILSAVSKTFSRSWQDLPRPPATPTRVVSNTSADVSPAPDGQRRDISPLIPVHMGPHKPEYPTRGDERHDETVRVLKEIRDAHDHLHPPYTPPTRRPDTRVIRVYRRD